MRKSTSLGLLLVVAASLWAQPDRQTSLKSLNFLQGIWTEVDGGYPARTTEFHWQQSHANLFLVGRSWQGMEHACPWCVTQTAMAFSYDPILNQIRLHLSDKRQNVLDFHLVSAGIKSLQFLTDTKLAMPIYRLTYTLSDTRLLSSTLEKAEPGLGNGFVSIAQISFQRR